MSSSSSSSGRSRRCWCGNAKLLRFSPDYLRCGTCDTLVYDGAPAQAGTRVADDATDFYGWEYFHSFQTGNHALPSFDSRARTDLPERCAYWLNALTQFKLPPARVLELGSGHGGFVGLLRQAGYEATGLDLSPGIVEFARRTFNVPVLVGPVEDQPIESGSLDAVVLMDVIEHLPDPLGTMRHCLSLLKPDGLLMIQTPCYPAGESYDTLGKASHRFLQHLQPGEHLNLFSRRALSTLFEQIGAAGVEFLPPIFWFYDQFAVASRSTLTRTTVEARDAALSQTPPRRFARALLDAEDRFRDLLSKHRAMIEENRKLREQLSRLNVAA